MLTKETLLSYLESCFGNEENEIATENKGGAGKGLFMIIENSDLVIFNIKEGVKTEVIALFNMDVNKTKQHRTPSFHYFLTN